MKLPATAVIIAAAGEGRRLGSRLPKALVPLAGTPLFLHSLRTFAALPYVKEIAVVLPAEWVDRIRKSSNGTRETDPALLDELCDTMFNGSLCGLGGMTPFPVRSALKHFRDDFLRH